MQRDLVKEFMEKQELKKRKAVDAVDAEDSKLMKPTAKARQPAVPAEPPSVAVTMEALGEAIHEDCDSVIFVSIAQKFQDSIVQDGDMETVKATQMMHGASFHRTKHVFNGAHVWKLIEASELGMLYMFKTGEGWYVASDLFKTDGELQKLQSKAETEIFVAAFGYGDHLMPDKLHLPYWAKKANPAVTIQSLWSRYLDTWERCEHMAECLKNFLDEATADPGGTEEAAETSERGNEAEEEAADAAEQPAGGNAVGRGAGRGGWMPKMASLISAIWAQDWRRVENLASTFYQSSQMLKGLVDRGVEYDRDRTYRHGGKGYHGKGSSSSKGGKKGGKKGNSNDE
jgi:hypothetical protein